CEKKAGKPGWGGKGKSLRLRTTDSRRLSLLRLLFRRQRLYRQEHCPLPAEDMEADLLFAGQRTKELVFDVIRAIAFLFADRNEHIALLKPGASQQRISANRFHANFTVAVFDPQTQPLQIEELDHAQRPFVALDEFVFIGTGARRALQVDIGV